MKKHFKILFSICLIVLFTISAYAQKVDTITVFSSKMNKNIKNVIILPAGYDKSKAINYPVIYLLHGHGGHYDTWLKIKKELPQEASKWGVILVCPEGETSWYWDSLIDPSSQFETYISKELVKYIDTNYKTISTPKGRAITGFSMGGHGALWQAFHHPDIFGACGSISGGVDIRPFPRNWDIAKRLGTYKEHPKVWNSHTITTQLDKIKPNTLAIIIDCGKDDFFYQVNEELHKKMLNKNIDHDYLVRPGGHTFKYWNNAIDYQLQFFYKFFQQKSE